MASQADIVIRNTLAAILMATLGWSGSARAFDSEHYMRRAAALVKAEEPALARSYLDALLPYWNLNEAARAFAYVLRAESFAMQQMMVSARKDFSRALEFDPDSLEARVGLGRIYLFGHGVEADPKLAMTLLASAAEEDSKLAAFHIGYAHLNGIGVEQDVAEARRWLASAAEAGLPSAMTNLAASYRAPYVAAADVASALRWYERAIELKHPPALVAKAFMLRSGEVEPRDPTQAAALLERAIALGSNEARVALGHQLMTGADLTKDETRAFALVAEAAAAGLPLGNLQLGYMLANGIGTAEDSAAAITAYRRAAQAGVVPAMQRLGHLLVAEANEEQRTEGLTWLRAAASTQTADAYNQLAWVLATNRWDDVRDGAAAVRAAEQAVALDDNASYLDTLAAAYAENGQFQEALDAQQRALDVAGRAASAALREELKQHLSSYERGQPWREP